MAGDTGANRGSGGIYESERQTRKQRIDPKLIASGWTVVRFASEAAATTLASSVIEEYETKLGPADYVFADDGALLGVVEAKKLTLGPQGVLPQAERYARAVPAEQPYQGEFGVPFLYSTNGEAIWFHDVRQPMNRSRKVSAFHTVKALHEMLERDSEGEFERLRLIPENMYLHDFQREANQEVENKGLRRGHRKRSGYSGPSCPLVFRFIRLLSALASSMMPSAAP